MPEGRLSSQSPQWCLPRPGVTPPFAAVEFLYPLGAAPLDGGAHNTVEERQARYGSHQGYKCLPVSTGVERVPPGWLQGRAPFHIRSTDSLQLPPRSDWGILPEACYHLTLGPWGWVGGCRRPDKVGLGDGHGHRLDGLSLDGMG